MPLRSGRLASASQQDAGRLPWSPRCAAAPNRLCHRGSKLKPRAMKSDDDMTTDPSRRQFLKQGGAALGSGWLAANWPAVLEAAGHAATAHAEHRSFTTLQPDEAADFEAIAARILPATQTPGARELGVIHFIDQALGGFMAGAENMLRPALAELNATVVSRHGTERFHQIDADAQDAMLREIENDSLFQTLRVMTLMGAFSLPTHGGNRDHLGWALLGFDHRHAWRPPFGHYDAPHHQRTASAASATRIGGHHDGR
jgi:gluconate 2-dehydrogenase gamma chain